MLEGKWYQQGSAAYQAATFTPNTQENTYLISIEGETVHSGSLQALHASERLGNIERKITLEDTSTFMTYENDKVDILFKKVNPVSHFIHRLESHIAMVGLALVLTIVFTFSFFKWGLPWISYSVAHALPHSSNEVISKHTLKFLDDYIFEESELNISVQTKIKTHFQKNIAPLETQDNDIRYKLHFREWYDKTSIPNALALPSGDIVITDQFVRLCKTQDEMDAVLLHEMGHIAERHTLQTLIEGTFVTVVVMLVFGDSNGLADMGVGLGSLLVNSHYSRAYESNADTYAFKKMLLVHKDPKNFSSIMNRMTEYMRKSQEKNVLDYLSSHPRTEERVKVANAYSTCFKQGLTTCEVSLDK